MDNTKKSPTVLSLCTGYGGIERGLELAGLRPRVLAHVEIEAYAAANLVAKMETGGLAPCPIWTDVKTFPSRPFRDRVDILTGGYPCQPFSVAGKQRGSEDPRHIWPFISKIIRDVNPRCVFFENVEGHVKRGLDEVLYDLQDAGYRTTWGIFSAFEVGAWHLRKRVFIYGEAADSEGKRIQGLRASGQQELAPHVRPPVSLRSSKRYISSNWKTEPRLDRVVNGCPNRVDRIRLLGNGVVPSTAAKAWSVLSQELQA